MAYKFDCVNLTSGKGGRYTQEGWEHAFRFCDKLAFKEYHGYTKCPENCRFYEGKGNGQSKRIKVD